jgi:cardiolipin synthase
LELLVGSKAFWDRLQVDIAQAQDRVWVQTLSFEGDSVGLDLSQAVMASSAPDKRILVDEFTRWMQNDRFLWTPRNQGDPELQAEVQETNRMLRSLTKAGVGVRWGSPWGFMWRRALWRNHKKICLVDNSVCYLGGINFSEHNFAWHDVMIRIEHPGATNFCAEDFRRSWEGETSSEVGRFPGLDLVTIDPPDISTYQEVFRQIREARDEIIVEAPYLSFPFTDALGEAAERGVKVIVLSPEENNWSFYRPYISWEAQRKGFELWLLPGMTHMKAMIFDRRTVAVGSANFDFLGHHTHYEIVAMVTNSELVQTFYERVFRPDLESSRRIEGGEVGQLEGWSLRLRMKAFAGLLALPGRGPVPTPKPVFPQLA